MNNNRCSIRNIFYPVFCFFLFLQIMMVASFLLFVGYVATTYAYPEDFDCPMRQLALEFAMDIQPYLAADQLQEIADALNGSPESVNKSCVTVPANWKKKYRTPPTWDDLKYDNRN
eukprot:789342_1